MRGTALLSLARHSAWLERKAGDKTGRKVLSLETLRIDPATATGCDCSLLQLRA